MDLIRSTYKKITSLLLCVISVIGLATGVRNLASGMKGDIGIIGGEDGPTAVFVSTEDSPFKTFLRFVAIWSAIVAGIATTLLVLIKKYVED